MGDLTDVEMCSDRPRVRRRRRIGMTAVAVVALAFAPIACSSDDSSSGESADSTEAPADTGGGATDPTDPSDDTGGDDDPVASDEPITSEDICAAVTTEMVATATGLEITGSEPYEGSTPQCSYSYPSENGPDSSFTIAATRYTEDDAQTIEEAFDGAVEINVATAGGDQAEQTEVEAGDQAVIISSDILTTGMVRIGNVMATAILPPDTVTTEQYEATLVALADAFA
jgi:hypothetical protein